MIGKIVCELTPGKGNSRNSEGAFLKLKNGNLLYAYSRYGGGGDDDECLCDLYGILSEDGGEHFGTPFPLLTAKEVGADNVMSVSLLRMKNGDLWMFYLQKQNEKRTCVPYLARSADEGRTWSERVRCIPENGYFVLNNDRVIELRNGRLLMPVARHEYVEGVGCGKGEVLIYASDDDGRSWHRLSGALEMPAYLRRSEPIYHRGCMEPGLAELADGTVWCFIRTVFGRQYETFSEDGGKSWTPIQPSPFTSPVSPMSVKALRDGQLCAVWNPVPLYNGRTENPGGFWNGGRTPLGLALLGKNGEYPSGCTLLETDERRGFCYCAIHETESGDLLLGYCAGGPEDGGKCLNRVRIRKITRAELADVVSV